MSDFFEKVSSQVDPFKKLLSYIPGFSGYIERQNRRDADKILRDTVARRFEELGESVLFSAQRELLEETGLLADLWLCGTVIVDAGDASAGICLFVFCGENVRGEIKASEEGAVEWVTRDAVTHLPVVEDLPILLERINTMQRGDAPFSARSYYDENDRLKVVFGE